MWDLILSVPDHCLSFYFTQQRLKSNTFANCACACAIFAEIHLKSHKETKPKFEKGQIR